MYVPLISFGLGWLVFSHDLNCNVVVDLTRLGLFLLGISPGTRLNELYWTSTLDVNDIYHLSPTFDLYSRLGNCQLGEGECSSQTTISLLNNFLHHPREGIKNLWSQLYYHYLGGGGGSVAAEDFTKKYKTQLTYYRTIKNT